MRIAGHTMGTPEHTLDGAIDLFARIGLEGIEIVCQDEYPSAISPGASDAEAAAVGRRARDAGLEPISLTPYTRDFNALDEDQRRAAVDEMRRNLDLARAIGASYVRTYAGAFPPGTDRREERWARLAESLRVLGEHALKAGVTLAVENHFNTMTPSARLTVALVDEVAHPNVRILYDQANLTFQGDEPYEEAIPLQAGRVVLAHVKDLVFKEGASGFTASKVFVVSEDERKIRSRVVGEGVLPWRAILRALAATGYDGWLSLEYERRWHPQDLPPAEDGMRRGAEHVRALLAELEPRLASG